MKKSLQLALIALNLAIAAPARSATIVWTNTAGGNWSDAANWSPNQVPGQLNSGGSADDVLITNAGTYTVVLDEGAAPDYWDVRSLTLGSTGGGTQTLAMAGKILYVSPLTITGSGVLAENDSSFHADIAVQDGGQLLSTNGTYFVGTLAITNGGRMTSGGGNGNVTLHGQVMVESGGTFVALPSFGAQLASDGSISVGMGGTVNVQGGRLFLYGAMTNAGTVNITGGQSSTDIRIANNGTANDQGFLLNLSGGTINLNGSGGVIYTETGPDDEFINQGTIVATGKNHNISVSAFDNSEGVVSNLYSGGTLDIAAFTNTLAGTFYTTNGSTTRFSGGTAAAPLTPGSSLLLRGGGEFQFIRSGNFGWLDLPSDRIPNLQLVSGVLELETSFQGGAITNLALDGITLTNLTLPVTGTLATTNSVIFGAVTVESNAQLTAIGNGAAPAVHGAVEIKSGATFTENGANIPPDGSLTINAGAVVTAGRYDVYGPITNSGTLNLTSGASSASILYLYNDGTASKQGSLLNRPGGVVTLSGPQPSTIQTGTGPDDQFINQGTLVAAGSCKVGVTDFDTSSGTVTNWSGTLNLSTFTNTLTGIFYATNGATIQITGGTASAPLMPGDPLLLTGGGEFKFIKSGSYGWLDLPTDIIPNLQLVSGVLELEPTFQGGAITNLALEGMLLTNGPDTVWTVTNGTFAVTNSDLYGNFILANGGKILTGIAYPYHHPTFYGDVSMETNSMLTVNGADFYGDVTVGNGAEFDNLDSGTTLQPGSSMTINSGGALNSGYYFYDDAPITNSGTINVTNFDTSNRGYSFQIQNDGGRYFGGLLNEPSGQINFLPGAGATPGIVHYGSYSQEYVINEGTVVSSVSANIGVANFENSGTITNLSGTLTLGVFNNTLAGNFYTASNATTRFYGGTATNPVTPGTIALDGDGQFQFIANSSQNTYGWLDLPNDIIPRLDLRSGVLELEPGFQGGAITNLALDGIIFTNSNALAVTGTFNTTNSLLAGTLIVTNGTWNADADNVYGPVTIGDGGVLNDLETIQVHPPGSMTVDSAGQVNLSGDYLYLYAPMTNSGTVNLPNNNQIYIYNNGTKDLGGILNRPGGAINLLNSGGIRGSEGGDYVINNGDIVKSNYANSTAIDVTGFTNSGAITSVKGTLQLNKVALQTSGKLISGLNSASDYGKFSISGEAALAGTLGVQFDGDYVPATGTSFAILSYGSYSGAFDGFDLPGTLEWQRLYGSTVFTLVAQREFTISSPGTSNIVFDVSSDPGRQFVILTSTNLMQPFSDWTPVLTNNLDLTGYLSLTNTIDYAEPKRFFILSFP